MKAIPVITESRTLKKPIEIRRGGKNQRDWTPAEKFNFADDADDEGDVLVHNHPDIHEEHMKGNITFITKEEKM